MEQPHSPTISNSRGANRFRSRSLEVAALGLAASAAPHDAAAAIITGLVTQSPNSVLSIDGISPEGDISLNSMLNMDGELDVKLQGSGFLVRADEQNAQWTAGEIGYAGFVFDPTGSTPLYGWLEIQLDGSGTGFTVLQWAYEDSGDPITAGAIPEPSTAIMLGLGLAALARVGRSKRRRLPPRQQLIPPRGDRRVAAGGLRRDAV